MATLASLVIKILGDTAGLEAAVNKAGGMLDRLGTKGTAANKILKATAIGGGGTLVAGLTSSINVAANFEHAVDQVGAVAQATDKQLQGLEKTALRIGKDTAFSATEAAQAMEILAANGVSVEDIINGAADATVALAAAGGTDLRLAADTASTAMAVWNLEAREMTDLVNRLAGAANVSRFGVDDMSQAIAMGGGAAAAAGVEYQDFLAAIAASASSFSSGSDAGTSFKQFLNGLTPTSKPAKKALAELGLMTEKGTTKFFTATGQMKSMAEITDLLAKATANLSEEQKMQALETIFGSDAIRMAAALSKVNAQEFEALSNKMRDSSAADIAAQRMSNFKGSMEQLRGTIEVLQIELGQRFLPVLTSVTLFLAKHPKLLTVLAGIIATVVVVAIVAWTAATIAHTAALIAQGAALLFAYAPVIAIIAAIALLAAGIYLLITHWDEVSAAAVRFGAAVKEKALGALRSLLDWLRGSWPEVATIIAGPFAPLVALATDAFGIRSALEGGFTAMIDFLEDKLRKFVEWSGRQFDSLAKKAANLGRYLIPGYAPAKAIEKFTGINIPGLATGTPYVPQDMLAYLHKGEMVMPRPMADDMRAGGGKVGGQGRVSIELSGPIRVVNVGGRRDVKGALSHVGYGVAAQLRRRGVYA